MTDLFCRRSRADDLAAILDHAGIEKRVYGARQQEPRSVYDLHPNISERVKALVAYPWTN